MTTEADDIMSLDRYELAVLCGKADRGIDKHGEWWNDILGVE